MDQSRRAKIAELLNRLAETEAELEKVLLGEGQAEQRAAMRDPEVRWRRLFARLPALVFELDPDGVTLAVNPAVTAVTGFRAEELIGENWWGIFCPRELSRRASELQWQLRSADVSAYPLTLAAKNGEPAAVELTTANWYGAKGELERIVGIAVDVTARKRAEELWQEGRYTLERRVAERTAALKEAEEEREHLLAELEGAISAIADGVVICGADGAILRVNDAARELLHYSEDDLRAPLDALAARMRVEGAGGRPLPVSQWPASRALRGETVRGEILQVHPSEGRPLWVSASAAPIRRPDGALMGAIVTLTDISSLRELQEQHELYLHTISHDLRAPLTLIYGHTQLLRSALDPDADPEARKNVETVLRSAEKMNIMIEDLVDAARLEGGGVTLEKEEIEMGAFLEDFLSRSSLALDVDRIKVDLPRGLPPVEADASRLERVLLNLLSNALKYSPPDSPVRLAVRREGDELLIAVSDRGTGISPDDQAHIFDRFYRPQGQRRVDSVGLGLYITRMLVQAHGGRIGVESAPGEGSTFSFALPLSGRD